MIDTILNVAGRLWELRKALMRARRERRDRIATYFERISKCLGEVSAELKANQVPHGKCAELQTYARMLPDTIGDQIMKAEAHQLAQDLESAHEVELLLYQLGSSPDRDEELAKLDQAAGVFMALANTIKAAR